MSAPLPPEPVHGWIVLDKPLGLSSAGAVARVKGLARRAGWGKIKVGHGGTLDPLATGVLPIALGEATKLSGRLLDAVKGYAFTIAFGEATATDDREGALVATSDAQPTLAEVEAVLARFTGDIAQMPPAYSAIKVDGERAYARARAGEVVTMMERRVTISRLVLLGATSVGAPELGDAGEVRGWDQALGRLRQARAAKAGRYERVRSADLEVTCSKGTYVRSLARDIALALGTVGHVSALRRTRAGPFALAQAHALDTAGELCDAGRLADIVLPLTAGLDDIPALAVTPEEAALLRQGRRLTGRSGPTGLYLAVLGDTPVALVEVTPDEGVRVERGFNL